MLATSKVNYALSTMFVTALLLLAQQLISEDVQEAGLDRLGGTVVGLAAAVASIAVIAALAGRGAEAETGHADAN